MQASRLFSMLQKVHPCDPATACFARKQAIAPKVIDINDTLEGLLNGATKNLLRAEIVNRI
jgi:hypothetical protein